MMLLSLNTIWLIWNSHSWYFNGNIASKNKDHYRTIETYSGNDVIFTAISGFCVLKLLDVCVCVCVLCVYRLLRALCPGVFVLWAAAHVFSRGPVSGLRNGMRRPVLLRRGMRRTGMLHWGPLFRPAGLCHPGGLLPILRVPRDLSRMLLYLLPYLDRQIASDEVVSTLTEMIWNVASHQCVAGKVCCYGGCCLIYSVV